MKRVDVMKALSALALALTASASHAAYVKYEFTAHGTETNYGANAVGDFPADSPAALLGVGTQLSGYFYYDLSTPETYTSVAGSEPSFKVYYSTASVGYKLTSNTGYSFKADYTGPEVYDQNAVDVQDYHAAAAPAADYVHVSGQSLSGSTLQYSQFNLDGGYQVLNSTALPTALSLSDFIGTIYLRWEDGSGKMFTFNAEVDTLTPLAAVPEPESYAMLLAGLALVGAVGRRKLRRPPAA